MIYKDTKKMYDEIMREIYDSLMSDYSIDDLFYELDKYSKLNDDRLDNQNEKGVD